MATTDFSLRDRPFSDDTPRKKSTSIPTFEVDNGLPGDEVGLSSLSGWHRLFKKIESFYSGLAPGTPFSFQVTGPSSSGVSQSETIEFGWDGAVESRESIRIAETHNTYPETKLLALSRYWGGKPSKTEDEILASPRVRGWKALPWPDSGRLSGFIRDEESFLRLDVSGLDFLRAGSFDEHHVLFFTLRSQTDPTTTVYFPLGAGRSSHPEVGDFVKCEAFYHSQQIHLYFFPGGENEICRSFDRKYHA